MLLCLLASLGCRINGGFSTEERRCFASASGTWFPDLACFYPAVWPWASHCPSLDLSILIWKTAVLDAAMCKIFHSDMLQESCKLFPCRWILHTAFLLNLAAPRWKTEKQEDMGMSPGSILVSHLWEVNGLGRVFPKHIEDWTVRYLWMKGRTATVTLFGNGVHAGDQVRWGH